MLFSLLFLTIFSQAAEPKAIQCVSQYRKVESNSTATEKELALVLIGQWPGLSKYEASLEGRYFSVNFASNGDIFSTISQESNLTKGIVTRGTFDSTGRFSSTEVDGAVIYKLVCTAKLL